MVHALLTGVFEFGMELNTYIPSLREPPNCVSSCNKTRRYPEVEPPKFFSIALSAWEVDTSSVVSFLVKLYLVTVGRNPGIS